MWLAGHLTEENLDKVRQLTTIAADLDITVGQLALAWILRRPEISSAIVGATSVEQLLPSLAASDIELSDETQERIATVLGDPPRSRVKF